MLFILSLLAGCASVVGAADFITTLNGNPDLSNLTYYLNLFPDFRDKLNSSSNITILAPSNEAFQKTLANPSSQLADAKVSGFIDTVLSYHIVNGTLSSSSISNEPQFLPTWLTDKDWTMLTGGQVVEAVTNNGKPSFISGLKQAAAITQGVGFAYQYFKESVLKTIRMSNSMGAICMSLTMFSRFHIILQSRSEH